MQFRSTMRAFPVLAVRDVRTVDPRFDRRRLTEWQAKEYIRRLAKGCYHFTDADMDEMPPQCSTSRRGSILNW